MQNTSSFFVLLITGRQILDSSKLKDFADDDFKFDENSRKLFKPLKTLWGKREIAHYEQFLLFPQCFQEAYFPEASKGVTVLGNGLTTLFSREFLVWTVSYPSFLLIIITLEHNDNLYCP